jgi:excisionase family DNA binding protein
MPDPKFLSRSAAALYLGVSPQTLMRWAKTGRPVLTCFKVGGRWKYRREDLEEFLDRGACIIASSISAAFASALCASEVIDLTKIPPPDDPVITVTLPPEVQP